MIKEVLIKIREEIDYIRYKYNKEPDEIILGVEIFSKIKDYLYCEYYYKNKIVDLVIKNAVMKINIYCMVFQLLLIIIIQ